MSRYSGWLGLEGDCGGFGFLVCFCGGDLCVCGSDGETCPGCEECEQDDGDEITDDGLYGYWQDSVDDVRGDQMKEDDLGQSFPRHLGSFRDISSLLDFLF